MSLTLKFALFTSIISLVIVAGMTYYAYHLAYQDLESSIGQRLEAIVTSGALHIDGTMHDQIKDETDAEGAAFLEIRDYLRRLKEANNLSEEVYTFRREGETLKFIVMTNDKPYIGHEYSIRREMLPTLNEGKPARTGVYHDTHGEWISAYAPIFDRDGHISGLLEADIRVEEFLTILRGKFTSLLWFFALVAAIAVALSFLLARTVTAKLKYLTDITEKISLGKVDTPIELKGKDEVAVLGASLERMRESIKIAAEMMR